MNKVFINNCHKLLAAYSSGLLGDTTFPEEQHPRFYSHEDQLVYFTLPMSLNYRRSSQQLWKAALETYLDNDTYDVFLLQKVAQMPNEELMNKLKKHKLGLLPNISTKVWKSISTAISFNWGSLESLITSVGGNITKLRQLVTNKYKKGFPFLSGPKIFNYWNLILMKYCGVTYRNRSLIDIAPDVHVTRSTVKLGLISPEEATAFNRQEISDIWRKALQGSGIDPIDMHPPLWFWSKNGYIFDLQEKTAL